METGQIAMRTIIAGSRDIVDMDLIDKAIKHFGVTDITEVVSGGARGVDLLAIEWAKKHGIPCTTIDADWKKHGKSAGYKRNFVMLEYIGKDGQAIVIWDGRSTGSKHMADICRFDGVKVYLYETTKIKD